ncbi:hypothetical protein Pcinc_026834 [Petrolisthes cinctipes]|uniref:ETS domain-containing protein n=1 Tax=Petrolisthes cinctipes TaxID=88211 RepID=A0AAE1F677_PETCI|nr:hypothetical protein Pcinc_026834 [Petrolisthes cinctipes]
MTNFQRVPVTSWSREDCVDWAESVCRRHNIDSNLVSVWSFRSYEGFQLATFTHAHMNGVVGSFYGHLFYTELQGCLRRDSRGGVADRDLSTPDPWDSGSSSSGLDLPEAFGGGASGSGFSLTSGNIGGASGSGFGQLVSEGRAISGASSSGFGQLVSEGRGHGGFGHLETPGNIIGSLSVFGSGFPTSGGLGVGFSEGGGLTQPGTLGHIGVGGGLIQPQTSSAIIGGVGGGLLQPGTSSDIGVGGGGVVQPGTSGSGRGEFEEMMGLGESGDELDDDYWPGVLEGAFGGDVGVGGGGGGGDDLGGDGGGGDSRGRGGDSGRGREDATTGEEGAEAMGGGGMRRVEVAPDLQPYMWALSPIWSQQRRRARGPICWEFLVRLLANSLTNPSLVMWEDEESGTFRLVQADTIARLWGIRVGRPNLSKNNFARALRHHYGSTLVNNPERQMVYGLGQKARAYLINIKLNPDY